MTAESGTERAEDAQQAREVRRGNMPRFRARQQPGGRALLALVGTLLVITLITTGLLLRQASPDTGSATAPASAASASAATAAAAREVTVTELRTYATGTRGLYWAGKQVDRRLELTATSDGRSYVRYLPPEVPLGDSRPAYTTVATYPEADAHGLLTQRAEAGDQRADVGSGGLATWSADRPTSVYLAYPGFDYLVEVFDPDAARARELVTSGQIRPVS